MIQKFQIIRDKENDTLTIKEFAILDRVIKNIEYQDFIEKDFSLICEKQYSDKTIKTESRKGTDAVISAIRTPNFYPVSSFAQGIADSIVDLYSRQNGQPVEREVMFDDSELL